MPKRIFIKDGGLTSSVPTPAGYTVIGANGGIPKKQIESTISNLGGFTHYLGEQYLGGVIFNLYIGDDGQEHGHVVSLEENDSLALQIPPMNVGSTSTWDGLTNTSLYTNSPAKDYVESLGTGWYIPALDEFRILYNNRYFVNKTLSMIASPQIKNYEMVYWTSTEVWSNDPNITNGEAWMINVEQFSSSMKDNPNYVRAIKQF